MTKRLNTVEEVIACLGGPRAVAEIMDLTAVSTVPTWKHRKRFPAKTFTILQSALQQRGLSAPNDLWGMP